MKKKPDEHTIDRIFRELIGQAPGLYLPVPDTGDGPQAAGNRMARARFIVLPGWSDVVGGQPRPGELWNLLQRTPMPGSLLVAAMINLIVHRHDPAHGVHARLCQVFLTAERLADLKKLLEENPNRPDSYNLFTRSSLLLLIRLVLALAPPSSAADEPRHLLGDLMLLVNEYALGSRSMQHNRLKNADWLTFVVEVLPTWELANPPDLAYGLSRAYRMLQLLLRGEDALVKKLRDRLPIDFSTITFDGLLVEDYIGCVFGIHAWLNSLDAQELLDGRTNLVIDSSKFLSNVKFPKELLEVFVAARGRTLDELRAEVAQPPILEQADLSSRLSSDTFISDMLALRNFPLWRLDKDRFVCLDAPFLVELLIYGLYWRILESLKAKRKDGNTFLELWGRLFELYLGEMLTSYYPRSGLTPLKLDCECDGRQVDAFFDFGDDVVIFEFKGALLKNEAKSNRDTEAFRKDFALKFIENEKKEPKALRQLALSAKAAALGKMSANPAPKRIFPILVGYEPCLDSFCVNSYADEEFERLLSPGFRPQVRPLTVMSVATFEMAVAYTAAGDISWPELLGLRYGADGKVVHYSVHQTIFDWRIANKRDARRNEFVQQGLRSAMEGALRKYRVDGSDSPKGS